MPDRSPLRDTCAARRLAERFLTAWLAVALVPCGTRASAGETTGYRVELVDPVSPTAPARAYEVVQSRDENGFPLEYSLSFETHVCTDGQCKPVDVTLVWNAVGCFERLEHPPDKPLTKKDHVPFTLDDYAKLDRILKDRNSILAGWTLAYLERPTQDGDAVDAVDAVTAPTPATVRDSIIEDAAYTTWTLWQWANGSIVPKLRAITGESCTPVYLKHLLASADRRFVDFALDYLVERHPSDRQFVDSVLRVLENGEREQIDRCLEFLRRAISDRQERHARLIEACCRMPMAERPMVLQRLAAEPDLPASTLEGLTGRLGQLPYFSIHLILRMLEQRKFASEKSISDVAALLEGDDFFIARRAYEHLVRHDLDSATQAKVEAFRRRHRDRL